MKNPKNSRPSRQTKSQRSSKKPVLRFFSKKSFLFILFLALVGTGFLIASYAAPISTAPKCTTSPGAGNSKNAVSVCKKIGASGGLTYWMDVTYPGKRVHVLRIDLTNKQLSFRASRYEERGKTPTEFAQLTKSIAAINGDFFYKDKGYTVNGMAVGSGFAWPGKRDTAETSFIACTNNKDCFIDELNSVVLVDPRVHTTMVSGSSLLLSPTYQWELKPNQPGCGPIEHTCSNEHPRTGLALSADRKTMWWVVVEGRHENVTGLSLYDFTQVLKNLGARWAINLDGGGSSGMALNGKLVNVRPASDPVERKVGNVLGIIETVKK